MLSRYIGPLDAEAILVHAGVDSPARHKPQRGIMDQVTFCGSDKQAIGVDERAI